MDTRYEHDGNMPSLKRACGRVFRDFLKDHPEHDKPIRVGTTGEMKRALKQWLAEHAIEDKLTSMLRLASNQELAAYRRQPA